jgi:hypothetical protein
MTERLSVLNHNNDFLKLQKFLLRPFQDVWSIFFCFLRIELARLPKISNTHGQIDATWNTCNINSISHPAYEIPLFHSNSIQHQKFKSIPIFLFPVLPAFSSFLGCICRWKSFVLCCVTVSLQAILSDFWCTFFGFNQDCRVNFCTSCTH